MLIIALLYAGKMSSYVTGSPLSKYLWDRKVPTSYLAKQIEVNQAIPQPRKENIKYQIEHEALKSQPLELSIAKALNSHHAPSLADLASNSM